MAQCGGMILPLLRRRSGVYTAFPLSASKPTNFPKQGRLPDLAQADSITGAAARLPPRFLREECHKVAESRHITRQEEATSSPRQLRQQPIPAVFLLPGGGREPHTLCCLPKNKWLGFPKEIVWGVTCCWGGAQSATTARMATRDAFIARSRAQRAKTASPVPAASSLLH